MRDRTRHRRRSAATLLADHFRQLARPHGEALEVLSDVLYAADGMPELRRNGFVGRDLEVQLPVYVSRASAQGLSDLRLAAANGALLRLQRNGKAAAAMRLTKRDMELLRELRAARWLTTTQVRRRFFARTTLDAARKRLHKLSVAQYVFKFQKTRMDEAFFTLGRESRRALDDSNHEITLERKLPQHTEHFEAVNDTRLSAELTGYLEFFFAHWEYPALDIGAYWPLKPDAIIGIRNQRFAAEIDCSNENLQFFLRTKIAAYRRGLEGFPLTAVLIVVDRKARMQSLARAIRNTNGRFLFTLTDLVREHDFRAPIFFSSPETKGVSLV